MTSKLYVRQQPVGAITMSRYYDRSEFCLVSSGYPGGLRYLSHLTGLDWISAGKARPKVFSFVERLWKHLSESSLDSELSFMCGGDVVISVRRLGTEYRENVWRKWRKSGLAMSLNPSAGER